MSAVVTIEVEKQGHWYEIYVLDPATGEDLDHHRGGNSPWESTITISADDPQALPFEKMREYALQTANEMAEEHDAAVDENIEIVDMEEMW